MLKKEFSCKKNKLLYCISTAMQEKSCHFIFQLDSLEKKFCCFRAVLKMGINQELDRKGKFFCPWNWNPQTRRNFQVQEDLIAPLKWNFVTPWPYKMKLYIKINWLKFFDKCLKFQFNNNFFITVILEL